MIQYYSVLLLVAFTAAFPSQNLHPLSDEFIHEINSKQSSWKAGRNFKIEEYELFKTLASGVKEINGPKVYRRIHDEDADIPESFDSREAWPHCADVIGLIRDQSRCDSGWAFGAVAAISDRICIHSNGTRKNLVSAQYLLACSEAGGCKGGWPLFSWTNWMDHGIVTGGLYNNTQQGCQSYFLAPCEDHLNNCRDYVNTPICKQVCDDQLLDFKGQETYGKDIVRLGGEKQTQLEILNNGPVEATLDIYSDFASYKSGIYQYTNGSYVGGHACKIIGWGVENDIKYWLVANSWNERWGENGYFRIIRGQNEVRIEDELFAGVPDFSRF